MLVKGCYNERTAPQIAQKEPKNIFLVERKVKDRAKTIKKQPKRDVHVPQAAPTKERRTLHISQQPEPKK